MTDKTSYSWGDGDKPESYNHARYQDRAGAQLEAEHHVIAEHGGIPHDGEPTQIVKVTTCRCDEIRPGAVLADSFSAVRLFEEAEEQAADAVPWLDEEYFIPPGEAIVWLQTKVENACHEAAMRFRLAMPHYNAEDLEVVEVTVKADAGIVAEGAKDERTGNEEGANAPESTSTVESDSTDHAVDPDDKQVDPGRPVPSPDPKRTKEHADAEVAVDAHKPEWVA